MDTRNPVSFWDETSPVVPVRDDVDTDQSSQSPKSPCLFGPVPLTEYFRRTTTSPVLPDLSLPELPFVYDVFSDTCGRGLSAGNRKESVDVREPGSTRTLHGRGGTTACLVFLLQTKSNSPVPTYALSS